MSEFKFGDKVTLEGTKAVYSCKNLGGGHRVHMDGLEGYAMCDSTSLTVGWPPEIYAADRVPVQRLEKSTGMTTLTYPPRDAVDVIFYVEVPESFCHKTVKVRIEEVLE